MYRVILKKKNIYPWLSLFIPKYMMRAVLIYFLKDVGNRKIFLPSAIHFLVSQLSNISYIFNRIQLLP